MNNIINNYVYVCIAFVLLSIDVVQWQKVIIVFLRFQKVECLYVELYTCTWSADIYIVYVCHLVSVRLMLLWCSVTTRPQAEFFTFMAGLSIFMAAFRLSRKTAEKVFFGQKLQRCTKFMANFRIKPGEVIKIAILNSSSWLKSFVQTSCNNTEQSCQKSWWCKDHNYRTNLIVSCKNETEMIGMPCLHSKITAATTTVFSGVFCYNWWYLVAILCPMSYTSKAVMQNNL